MTGPKRHPVEGRLDPLVVILGVVDTAKGAVPILAGLSVIQGSLVWFLGAVGVLMAASLAFRLVAWFRFRYRVTDSQMEVESGVLVRRHRVVPLERIRGVSFNEPFLYRIVGLVKVDVDSASAGPSSSELSLAGVRPAQAEALRDAVMSVAPHAEIDTTGASAVVEDPQGRVIARATPAQLMLAGATSLRYTLVPLAILGAIWGIVENLGQGGVMRDTVGTVLGRAEEFVPHTIGAAVVLVLIGGTIAVVLAAIGSLVVDWGFTTRTEARRITTERGLISRNRVAAERSRVLGVQIRRNPITRMIGVARVDAPLAGVSGGDSREHSGHLALAPCVDMATATDITQAISPGERPALTAHPDRGLPRRLLRAEILPVIATGVLAYLGSWWALLAGGVVAAMAVVAVDRQRILAYGFGRWLVVRSGSFFFTESVMEPDSVVAIEIRSSVFQRRRRLCTVHLHRGLGVPARNVIDVGDDQAACLAAQLMPWASSRPTKGSR